RPLPPPLSVRPQAHPSLFTSSTTPLEMADHAEGAGSSTATKALAVGSWARAGAAAASAVKTRHCPPQFRRLNFIGRILVSCRIIRAKRPAAHFKPPMQAIIVEVGGSPIPGIRWWTKGGGRRLLRGRCGGGSFEPRCGVGLALGAMDRHRAAGVVGGPGERFLTDAALLGLRRGGGAVWVGRRAEGGKRGSPASVVARQPICPMFGTHPSPRNRRPRMSAATSAQRDTVVAKAIQDISHIATLPEVTLKIIDLVEDPTATAQDLHRVITNDPALCSR